VKSEEQQMKEETLAQKSLEEAAAGRTGSCWSEQGRRRHGGIVDCICTALSISILNSSPLSSTRHRRALQLLRLPTANTRTEFIQFNPTAGRVVRPESVVPARLPPV
jgi:hypothetical protein